MQYGYDTPNTSGPVPAPPVNGSASNPVRRSRVTAGVVLIVLGVAFLAAQFVPGFDWWTLWPLAIVVVGVVQIVTPGPWRGWGVERVSDGIGTILLGMLLLGNTTGYVSWSVWWILLSLWPVLLISAGIALLGKASGQEWLRALASIPVWITMIYAAGLAWTGAPLPIELAPVPFSLFTVPTPPIPPIQ